MTRVLSPFCYVRDREPLPTPTEAKSNKNVDAGCDLALKHLRRPVKRRIHGGPNSELRPARDVRIFKKQSSNKVAVPADAAGDASSNQNVYISPSLGSSDDAVEASGKSIRRSPNDIVSAVV